jgi:hypothetical protein
MIVIQGKKYLSCSLGEFKLLFHKDMIIPREKKSLSCSLKQFKFLFLEDMIVPWGKANFLKNNELLRGKAQVP